MTKFYGTPKTLRVLHSTEDESVNFVQKASVGFFESRYVHRPGADYFIVYLSSQSGCNRGCGFCHLTTTRQTQSVDSYYANYMEQSKEVFQFAFDNEQIANKKYVHFNFMARGEPLVNDLFMVQSDEILSDLGDLAMSYGLASKFNISTIMPKSFKGSLLDVFKYTQPTLYYSLYSTDPAFRAKWLPGAMDVNLALERLKEYQEFTQKPIKLHWAYIEGENDLYVDAKQIVDKIKIHKLLVDINIVRYNPPDSTSSESPSERIQGLADYYSINLGRPVQIVKRVGMDVKASCGMFVAPDFEV